MLPSIQDELWRKAVYQIAFLQSAYENDRISAESFKIGVETIWEVLGGVVDTNDFRDLIHEANVEVAGLKIEPRIRVLSRGDTQVMIERLGERIRVSSGSMKQISAMTFGMEGEAIEAAHLAEARVKERGFQREA